MTRKPVTLRLSRHGLVAITDDAYLGKASITGDRTTVELNHAQVSFDEGSVRVDEAPTPPTPPSVQVIERGFKFPFVPVADRVCTREPGQPDPFPHHGLAIALGCAAAGVLGYVIGALSALAACS